ncbi:transporter substrate-binding domain-containing protein [Paenibacillus larvae]|uniref:ABC transporter glutamine-binding protein GlnH n=1 Tax=Paenibacillus larvae subsp. larvae TaxID=147375 RepID=A0A6C0QUE8_9BACL|nr:transporter substrate-binding domain-containing protein [Paenibacillus larvae]QHZ52243.1 ABC transporter glutamine-binding protein GlnH [Paenibacillus larvae subsp. larvae]
MKKKSFKIMVLFLLVALALVGCGGKKEGEAGASSSPSGKSGGETAAGGTFQKIKERGKLIVGVKYDTNLFGLKDPASGEITGYDVDFAKALAKKFLGDENKLELEEVNSKTRIPMLDNGEIDAIIATMTISEERKKQVDFSDVYFKAGQSLLVKKGSPIKGIGDIRKGTKVLTAKGATSGKNIKEKAEGVQVLEYENYQEAFNALKAGKGDALTTDNSILYGMVKQDPNFEVVGEPFTDEPYGIAVKKGEAEFLKEVNGLLKEMQSNGEADKIYEKWIGEKPKK